MNINNEKNNRFIYEKDVCIKYPNGKPEEIKQTKKRCEYLDIKK